MDTPRADIDEAITMLCRAAVLRLIQHAPDTTIEERVRMRLGMQHPTPEYEAHMQEFEQCVADLLIDGAAVAMNGLSGLGYEVAQE